MGQAPHALARAPRDGETCDRSCCLCLWALCVAGALRHGTTHTNQANELKKLKEDPRETEAAADLATPSHPTLCDPTDYAVPGILQA